MMFRSYTKRDIDQFFVPQNIENVLKQIEDFYQLIMLSVDHA